MLSTAPIFTSSASFTIGNGKSTSFWNARWSGDLILRNLFPNLFAVASLKHLSVYNWIRRFGTQPNLGFDLNLGPEATRELPLLKDAITNIILSNTEDLVSWKWSANGSFSVKNAYKFLAFDGVNDSKIRHLWGIRIPLKIKIFLWITARYRLLTAELLLRRGWQGPSICMGCGASDENPDHLFFYCKFARSLWEELLQLWPTTRNRILYYSGDFASRWEGARLTLTGQAKGLFDYLFAATCWEIWLERNRRIFSNNFSQSASCAFRIHNTINTWILALGV